MAQVAQTSPFFALTPPRHFRCDGGETLEFWVRFGVHFQIYTRLFSQRKEGAIGHSGALSAEAFGVLGVALLGVVLAVLAA